MKRGTEGGNGVHRWVQGGKSVERGVIACKGCKWLQGMESGERGVIGCRGCNRVQRV